MKDERVINSVRQVRSETMILILAITLISFVIKIVVFDMSMTDCITEWSIMLLAAVYTGVRSRMLKLYNYEEKEIKVVFIFTPIMVFGTTMAIIYLVVSGDWRNTLLMLTILMAVVWMALIANKKIKEKALEYDDDEIDD